MFGKVRTLVLALLLVTGCTWRAELPAVGRTHPANPEAEAAPALQPSEVLSVDEPVEAPEPMPPMHHGMEEQEHEGHGMEVAP